MTAATRSRSALRKSLASAAATIALATALAPSPAPAETSGKAATDGYFDVSRIDPDTYAIHEPRYWQRNVMYVLKGETRAILFDTGSGTRDIAWVADKVTKKPMTAVASHVHYDHIGSHASFKSVAMVDLPETRAATSADGWYSPPMTKSLYAFAGGFQVTEWWKPGDTIDIGGRLIEVVHIPGHSTDSIALVDRKRGYAFVGDHFYGGMPLLANLPGSDLAAYVESTRKLLRDFPEIRMIYGAHAQGRMKRESLEALEKSLTDILEKRATGERIWWLGWMTARYPGDGFSIYAAP